MNYDILKGLALAAAIAASVIAGALLLDASLHAAQSHPPAKDSEDWAIVAPYSEWIQTQHTKDGAWCCDWSDGRPLFEGEWREPPGGEVEVFISRRHWENAPLVGRWVKVAKERITAPSPVGLPIVWWTPGSGTPDGFVFCFAPVGGV